MDLTFLTLFHIMTLDSWSTILNKLMIGNIWVWVPMILFFMISSFIVVNLIIAVICNVVAKLYSKKIEEELIQKMSSYEGGNIG